MKMTFRYMRNSVISLGLLLFIASTAGCLEKNTPAPASVAQMSQPSSEATTTIAAVVTPKGQNIKLFDFASKTPDNVIEDYKQNKNKYQSFNKPKPDSTGDAGLTDRDYLLEGLSAGMDGAYDLLLNGDKRTLDYDKVSKLSILRYYYCKYLYDIVISGKLSIEQAKTEADNMFMFTDENSLESIENACKQIDDGKTFADIRKENPQWFIDRNAPAPTKGPKG
jgi:hypothetical protein